MSLRSIDHVSFAVRDLQRSLHFYCEVLGLEQTARPDLGFPGAWLKVGDGQVHLIEVPADFDAGTAPPQLNPLASHAAFAIDDHAAMLATLQRNGIEVLDFETSGQMWAKDPDGHIIELISARR
ncbi:MAG TPA: VOC family protein [Candidatus Limnocylindrales bacterium]|nr:VOC family protein [Candidatus Limnocylindrales bacterium]